MATLRDAWSSGSYAELATQYLDIAGTLVEQTHVSLDDRVLDVGTGTGNVAISAARRGASVTGVDVEPAMLSAAVDNTAMAGFDDIEWQTADATDLPFEDNAFDATLSCLGHMYADPPAAAAREVVRVTRQGGQIGFTSWTPTSVYPFMAGVLATYLPPDAVPDRTPPFMWGDSAIVEQRLDDDVASLAFDVETSWYPTLSPAHFWEDVATKSGVFVELLECVPDSKRAALRDEMIETVAPYFDERRNAVELEYLLVTAQR